MTEKQTRQAMVENLKAKLALGQMDVETLANSAIQANEDLEVPAIVLDALLDVLQENVTSDFFVEFCDTKL